MLTGFIYIYMINRHDWKRLMLGKIEGRNKRGWQRMRWLDGIHWQSGLEFGQTLGDNGVQRSLACCNPVQFSSINQLCPTLCDPMDCIAPGFPVHHQLLELAQNHVHQVSDAIQPHPLSFPSPPAFHLSQHQGLFRWISSSHQVAKVLEFQVQHQSFQWIFKTNFL